MSDKKIKKYWLDLTPKEISIVHLAVRVLINKCAQGSGSQDFTPYDRIDLYNLIERIDKWNTEIKSK